MSCYSLGKYFFLTICLLISFNIYLEVLGKIYLLTFNLSNADFDFGLGILCFYPYWSIKLASAVCYTNIIAVSFFDLAPLDVDLRACL